MRLRHALPSLMMTTALVAACGSDDAGPSADRLSEAVTTYADGVHASYGASLASAAAMDAAIDAFIADPSEETLAVAKDAWLAARDDYGPTEAFRFYNGPIDNEADGPEGLINAWPMDEAYVDYVEGNTDAGIINNPSDFPTIDADVLTEANEAGGEVNISTGWHAVEFLLWGQDLSEDGAGERPASDYVDAPNADRRATYLAEVSDLLLVHLGGLVEAWDPTGDGNYYDSFTSANPEESMTDIITGIGELSRGELAGERMNVAYAARSQEDEHSCFSDNTHNDIIANAVGIQRVLTATYPGGVSGTSLLDVITDVDVDLAASLEAEVAASVAAVEMIPAPFDQHLRDGVADDDPGRVSVLNGITALEDQTPTIVAAAEALGLTINVT